MARCVRDQETEAKFHDLLYMIVYHIPSLSLSLSYGWRHLLRHPAAICGVKIPTNRGMLLEGRGDIQGDSSILAPEKTIALGIGDPRPPLLGKCPTYSRYSSRQVECTIGWEPFWHAKNNLVNRHQEVGLGQTPHPQFGNFSHIIPFFF